MFKEIIVSLVVAAVINLGVIGFWGGNVTETQRSLKELITQTSERVKVLEDQRRLADIQAGVNASTGLDNTRRLTELESTDRAMLTKLSEMVERLVRIEVSTAEVRRLLDSQQQQNNNPRLRER